MVDREQLGRVSAWLAAVFHPGQPPPFEVNARSVALLDALRETAARQSRAAVLEARAARRASKEYRAETSRLAAMTSSLDVSPAALSPGGRTRLADLADLAVLVGARGDRQGDLLAALSRTSEAAARLAAANAKSGASARRLGSATKQILADVAELQVRRMPHRLSPARAPCMPLTCH